MTRTSRDYYQNLGRKIRMLRKLNDMTQTELAKAIGLTSSGAISQVENGLKGLKASKLVEIAELFHIHVDVLTHNSSFSREQLKMFMNFKRLVSIKNRSPKAKSYYQAILHLLEAAEKDLK